MPLTNSLDLREFLHIAVTRITDFGLFFYFWISWFGKSLLLVSWVLIPTTYGILVQCQNAVYDILIIIYYHAIAQSSVMFVSHFLAIFNIRNVWQHICKPQYRIRIWISELHSNIVSVCETWFQYTYYMVCLICEVNCI